ncbi:hypothetical protein WJX77_010766 [Trebouxia sp. C0004]
MRPARSRRFLYGSLAEANGTDESSDASSAEEESQDEDSEQGLRVKATGPPKGSTNSSGQYSEQSAKDTVSESSSQEEDTEYQVQDNNDECCSSCGSKKDSDKLLCCELCPRVYHLYCLKPPLKAIPSGDWFCIHCQQILCLEDVEKFLAFRTRLVDLEAERAEEAVIQQAAADSAAQAKKRKATSGKMPVANKKPKMASVQQLHTSNSTEHPQSQSASHSQPANQSQSAYSDGHRRAIASELEASSPPQDGQMFCAQQDADQGRKDASKSSMDNAHSAGPSADLIKASEAQQLSARTSSASTAAGQKQRRSPEQDGKDKGKGLTSVREYFVKWKGKAFIHCSWVKHDDVAKVAKYSAGLNMRFKHYQRSVYGMPQVATSGKLEDQEVGDMVNGIDPLWVLVDRVISQQEKKGKVQYLVKWKGLGYDESTWETPADILPKFTAELARFQDQHPIANELDHRKRSHAQASTSQADNRRSAAGRKVGRRKYGESPGFLAGGGSLHPYQLEGLNWLYFAWEQRKHVILADEMGLGKTIQSIAFLAALKEEKQVQKPHLVVVPLSTFPNWEREFALWAPQLNVVPFIGNQAGRTVIKTHELYAVPSQVKGKTKAHSRHAELQARVKFHVLLTTYEMVGSETGILRSLEYETLIVDEGHRLKNQQSKLFQQLHNFKTRQRTLLTGTPLQNNLSELWMLLHFLDASKFQSLEDFEADFSDLSHGDQIAKLHELLSPHLLRRLKKDVLKQLPPKKEQIVRVELSPLQKDWYRGILTKNFPNLTNGKQTGRLKSVMMELRKCCNHPFLIDEQEWPVTRDPKQFLQQLVQASGKLALIDSMLERMKDRGHRVLIYSQFTTLLDLLEEWLAARQWGYQRIDGSVGGTDRQSRIDQFNRRPADNFVFLLSTKAGGLGINLASADTVIIYDSDWNPHNDLQAQARAHRLGQLKPVMIYRLVTRLTIEERMMQQTKKKMMLEHLVVHKMNTAADLKQDELDDILRYGAAELFADAVAASQKAQPVATTEMKEGGDEVEGGAGLASKASVDKADKLIRLSEREQAEGRTGGQAGQRIVYDNAAIERLLDRSDLANADEDKSDEKEDDFVKGFKVANFEIMNSPDKEKAEAAVLEGHASGPQQPAVAFWDELLKNGYQDLQQVQMAALGKGKRERRKVNYDEKNAKGRDNVSDYSAQSEDSDQESGDEAGIDKPALKKLKSDNYSLTEAESREVQAVAQQRQASLAGGHLFTSGFNSNYRVLGFSNAQRASFMKVLMQFGLGEQLTGGKFDWSHIHRHMTGKWPTLALEQTCRYAELVMAQLSEAANGKPFFADGILKKEILQSYELNKVLDRLGTLHLIRHTLLKQMADPDPAFSLGPLHAPTLRPFKFWQAEHDKKLLYGVLKHGWAQWQVILKDSLLGIEPILRQELYMPPMQPPTPAAGTNNHCIATTPAQGLAEGPAGTLPAEKEKALAAGHQQTIDLTADTAADQGTAAAGSQAVSAEALKASGQAEPASTSPAAAGKEGPAMQVASEGQLKDQELRSEPADKVIKADSNADGTQPSQLPSSSKEATPKVVDTNYKLLAASVDSKSAGNDSQPQQALAVPVLSVKLASASASSIEPKFELDSAPAVKGEAPLAEVSLHAEPSAKLDDIVPASDSAPVSAPAAVAQPAHEIGVSMAQQSSQPATRTNAAGTAAVQLEAAQAGAVGTATVTSTAEAGSSHQAKPQVGLGCPKCRWAIKGCSACRAKYQNATLAADVPAGQAGKTGSPAVAAANASRSSQSDRVALNKMTNWLMGRTSTLCTALKQTHQSAPAPAQPQTRVTLSAPSTKLLSSSSGPIMLGQQTVITRPTGGVVITSAPGVTSVVQTGAGSSSASGTSPWQQQAVQMSQFRQQQRLIQQQQLAEAQRHQQQQLVLQQQQRQHHTSLLRQQHQTAQLQQQQQQAARAQASAGSALQLQQQRMRQQQQQQGLRQQQLQQRHNIQQQAMQQQLLQQQQQRQLTAQQQVQSALLRQGSQGAAGQQPRPAAVLASAAQHAQSQPIAHLQGQMNLPPGGPDKAGTPLLMAMHQQQAALRTASLPRSPSRPRSPSLSQQQAVMSNRPFQQLSSQASIPAQQHVAPQCSQVQEAGYQPSQLQPSATSLLDPAFNLLSDEEKSKRLRQFLLGVKPNLQPLSLDKLLQAAGHVQLTAQSIYDRKQLVGSYNWLCSKLLDVQVTLSQNKPQTMSDQDRNVAAAKFQHSMQEMDTQCARMIHELTAAQAMSGAPPHPAQLQPVLHGQGRVQQGQAIAARPQLPVSSASTLDTTSCENAKGGPARVPSGGLHMGSTAKGAPAATKGNLASLVAPTTGRLPARTDLQPTIGVQLAPPVQSPSQAVPTTQALASAAVTTFDSQVSLAGEAAPEQQPVQPVPPLKSVESIDLTAESDGEAN